MGNIVAIVGRPNVGKSTLFNRLTESRKAIVHESSGVTRDRHYGKSEWNGKEFSVIDTGGYINNSEDVFEEEIRKQVLLALNEAQSILLVVDVEAGITDLDDTMAKLLRKTNKPVLVVVNKVDNSDRIIDSHVFHALGLGELYPVSSISGSGTGELLDDLVKTFDNDPVDTEENVPRFAIVGRPNVGKSSLINALLDEERNIVTPISGTTRDTVPARYNKYGLDFYLIDTAGLRKKAKVKENVEFYSTMRSIRAIESADVCLLMIDAEDGIKSQDITIFGLIQKNHRGVVILVNKWDLIEKDNKTTNDFLKELQNRIAPYTDVPVIFTSALTKQRIFKALEAAVEVFGNMKQKIATSKLNDLVQEAVESTPPPSVKGKFIRIKYASQLPNPTPVFAFFCNLPQYIKDPYKRYLENRIREKFNFKGVPLQLYFRKK